ncbi:MAG: cobalamin-independent methionine synthase II family protein [Pseudolabrys sp.]|nr:cobalamin-independent methionine synthase II family protein [Pseudolabrys sp.]MDP2297915.1 cobalamin-independent methionine synthase II family protein [Pseudolabrys sp.]
MRRSTDRILTTHVGSLPRPHDLLDLMGKKLSGEPYDKAAYDLRVTRAVREIVAKQAECGIDIVADGEMSKPGFFSYVQERLAGFEPRPGQGPRKFAAEIDAFPEYYEDYFKRAMTGGTVVPIVPLFCAGPVTYVGAEALRQDLENLKAALAGLDRREAFVPSVAPSGVGNNAYYKSDEEFLYAVGEALRTEYLAIVEAGFLVQIDDPFLSDVFIELKSDPAQMRRTADLYVEVTNHALRGIAPEKIRLHTCYGINEGPRIHEAALAEVVGHMLRINAGAYSFEAANARHEHEYHLWETVKLPEGKILMPGVITHASNIVEHPELIAERLTRFARLVGRENVIASADCGFSSQASYKTEVHVTVMWKKLEALVEGARLASRALWQRAA